MTAPGARSAHDTVYALSSGAGRAGVAVVRLSGPASGRAIERLTGRALPRPRFAALRRLVDPAEGVAIDDALVLWFPAPRSETGEDMAEFHIHGGRAILAALFAVLGREPGLRPAEAGEFARRAFDNGKLDLTAAEGLADLVDAETEAQRRQALRQMEGRLGALYEGWRERLLRMSAHVEAAIDFPDEDLPEDVLARALADLPALAAEIRAHLADDRRGERLREGLVIAIVGAPNVGKSSLLNQIARRDVVIVSETAGTTRDVVEVHLDLAGYPVTLADTAGLRETVDAVEAEGVRRARARAAAADLRIAMFDAAAGGPPDPATAALVDERTIVVANKTDLSAYNGGPISGQGVLSISAASGAGIGTLLDRLGEVVTERFGAPDAPALTRARHRKALEEALAALERAGRASEAELVAEDLRLAGRALGRITGRVDVEDILDVIFRDFCIGK